MQDLIIKLALSDKERLLFSRLDMMVTPVTETEVHELALSIDQARGMFQYLLKHENAVAKEEWLAMRETLHGLLAAMDKTQTVLGRSALVGRGATGTEPLQ